MSERPCPWCGGTLRITNVIGTTMTVNWRCSNCCYREDTNYSPYDVVKRRIEPWQQKTGQQVLGDPNAP